MDLREQMNARSSQLKNGSKCELFSTLVDAQENGNETTINAFEKCLMIQ